MAIKLCGILSNNAHNITRHLSYFNGLRAVLSDCYVPKDVEREVSSLWRQRQVVDAADICAITSPPRSTHLKVGKFSMILPPPNVTGTLHLGHALTLTLQDVLAKRRSMLGEEVVWVPGLDHAGIATQAIVELVLSSRGLDAKTMSRETLLEHINTWKKTKSDVICQQLASLAPSLDWSRQFFTLNLKQSDAVKEAFLRLYESGLIYRAERLVNWSVALGSAISDIEVDYRPVSGPTNFCPSSSSSTRSTAVIFGQMTDVAFKLHNLPDEEVVVSTCRVETMPGDVAVAVHPNDTRYSRYHGSLLVHPLTQKLIPLILDDSVDPNFGTGAVKVTPGHDQADFDMASRHSLDTISVIDETGHLNSNSHQFSGLERFEARRVISLFLQDGGHIRGVRDHQMSVPLCSRTGDVIELITKPQWFLKCSEMGARALQAVERGDLQIIPDRCEKLWFSYLENIRDWCISRQVVWGHRIPLYSDSSGNYTPLPHHKGDDDVTKEFKQVDDVLDTWFSSSILPFSVFGWPHNKSEVSRYFPLDVMVTGHDIMFFWVARMVMLSLQLTDRLPFNKVLLHSVICDPQGRKMSKSKGNVIDPQHMIQGISNHDLLKDLEERLKSGALKVDEAELSKSNISTLFPQGIPECGADALRITLLSHKITNHYVHFDVDACHVNKLFCNKLWQACRFTGDWSTRLLSDLSLTVPPRVFSTRKIDIWLLSRLVNTLEIVDRSFDSLEFHIAVNTIKEFVQHTFCQVYLEAVKSVLKVGDSSARDTCYTLLFSLVTVIKMLAPMAPFLSEKLYQYLQPHLKTSVHISSWPTNHLGIELPPNVGEIEKEMTLCLNIIKEIRRLKLTLNDTKQGKHTVGVMLSCGLELSSDLVEVVRTQSKCQVEIMYSSSSTREDEMTGEWCHFSSVSQDVAVYSASTHHRIGSVVNRADGAKKLKKLEKELDKILKMTSHEGYKTKAKESVQKDHANKILRLQVEIKQIRNQI